MSVDTVHHLKTERGDEIFLTLVDEPAQSLPLLERRLQLTIFDVDGTLAPTVEISYKDAVAFFHSALAALIGDVA